MDLLLHCNCFSEMWSGMYICAVKFLQHNCCSDIFQWNLLQWYVCNESFAVTFGIVAVQLLQWKSVAVKLLQWHFCSEIVRCAMERYELLNLELADKARSQPYNLNPEQSQMRRLSKYHWKEDQNLWKDIIPYKSKYHWKEDPCRQTLDPEHFCYKHCQEWTLWYNDPEQ